MVDYEEIIKHLIRAKKSLVRVREEREKLSTINFEVTKVLIYPMKKKKFISRM